MDKNMLYIIIGIIIIISILIYLFKTPFSISNLILNTNPNLNAAFMLGGTTTGKNEYFNNETTVAISPQIDFHSISGIYNNIEEYFNLYFNKLINIDSINKKLNENIINNVSIKFQNIFRENKDSKRAQDILYLLFTNIYTPFGLLALALDDDVSFQLALISLTNIYNLKTDRDIIVLSNATDKYNVNNINYLYDSNTADIKIYTSTRYNKSISYNNATLANNMFDILKSNCLIEGICYMNKDYFKNQILESYKNINRVDIIKNYKDIMEYLLCMIVIFTIYISNDSYKTYKDILDDKKLSINKQIDTILKSLSTNNISLDITITLP